MKTLIGYHDYYKDTYEYSRYGRHGGELFINKQPNEIEKFFSSSNLCPFCNTPTNRVFYGYRTLTIDVGLELTGNVFECPKCNWWTYKTVFEEFTDEINEVNKICTETHYYGICQKYNVSDNDVPINILLNELSKQTDLLYNISPYKLEELTQHILKGVFDCQVYHVGRTGDGGKDLIVLDSDNPILVQVKRRKNPDKPELVKGVREFVGTLFIEDKQRGIYISTAKRFSKGSEALAKKLIQSRKLSYFEFVNYDKLCALIKQYGSPTPPWRKLVEEFYSDTNSVIYDT